LLLERENKAKSQNAARLGGLRKAFRFSRLFPAYSLNSVSRSMGESPSLPFLSTCPWKGLIVIRKHGTRPPFTAQTPP